MSTEEWTQLVKSVDRLIQDLKESRAQANHWRTRAAELERHQLGDNRKGRLEEQAKDRELERFRKERKKMKSTINKLLIEIEEVERKVMESKS